MSGVGITYLWPNKKFPPFIRLEGKRGDYEVYTPERTCENVAREWEKTSFAHACTSFCCSECGAHYVDAECYYAGLADKDEEQIRTNFCPNCGRKAVS